MKGRRSQVGKQLELYQEFKASMGYMGNQYLKTQDKKALGPVSGQAFCALIIIQMETLLHLGTHNTHHGRGEGDSDPRANQGNFCRK